MQPTLDKVEVFHVYGDWIKKNKGENHSERVLEFKTLSRCWLKSFSIVGFPSGKFRINLRAKSKSKDTVIEVLRQHAIFGTFLGSFTCDGPYQVKRMARWLIDTVTFDNEIGLKALKEIAPDGTTFNEIIPDKINLIHTDGNWNVYEVSDDYPLRRMAEFRVVGCDWLKELTFLEYEDNHLSIRPVFRTKNEESVKKIRKELENAGVMVHKSDVAMNDFKTQVQRETQNMAKFLQQKGCVFVEPEFSTILQQFVELKPAKPAECVAKKSESFDVMPDLPLLSFLASKTPTSGPERAFGKTNANSMLEALLLRHKLAEMAKAFNTPNGSEPGAEERERAHAFKENLEAYMAKARPCEINIAITPDSKDNSDVKDSDIPEMEEVE